MKKKTAILTIADSRDDYYSTRQALAEKYTSELTWVSQYATCYMSPILRSNQEIAEEMTKIESFCPQSLIINIPIWADPVFALDIALKARVPILLLGNTDPTTSSLVGLLGAGGALDQIGRTHERILGLEETGADKLKAFIDAASASEHLKGQEMLRFGDSPLGIVTAVPDNLLWLRDFGVKVRNIDEHSIIERAERISGSQVDVMVQWVHDHFASINFGNGFTPGVLNRQIRSYLALKELSEENGASIVGLRCQPDLSNNYANQCLSHLFMNAEEDAWGEKDLVTCSCESDANGALTMYIMYLLGGKPASLMDIRRVNEKAGQFLLANCGAMPLSHYQNDCSNCGVRMMRHAFGLSCAGACSGELKTGTVTMARICVRDGKHWMAIVRGESIPMDEKTRSGSPAQFPTAFIKTEPLVKFLELYGSNHIHIVQGDISEKLICFCRLKQIDYKVW